MNLISIPNFASWSFFINVIFRWYQENAFKNLCLCLSTRYSLVNACVSKLDNWIRLLLLSFGNSAELKRQFSEKSEKYAIIIHREQCVKILLRTYRSLQQPWVWMIIRNKSTCVVYIGIFTFPWKPYASVCHPTPVIGNSRKTVRWLIELFFSWKCKENVEIHYALEEIIMWGMHRFYAFTLFVKFCRNCIIFYLISIF